MQTSAFGDLVRPTDMVISGYRPCQTTRAIVTTWLAGIEVFRCSNTDAGETYPNKHEVATS
jgi:hypothetical protein